MGDCAPKIASWQKKMCDRSCGAGAVNYCAGAGAGAVKFGSGKIVCHTLFWCAGPSLLICCCCSRCGW